MDGAENLRACSTQPLSCAACLVNPKAGLLTDSWDARPAAFPLPEATVACFAGELADHSGATVRDLHPLPFWLGLEHLGTNGEIVATPRKKRQEISPLTSSGCGRPGLKPRGWPPTAEAFAIRLGFCDSRRPWAAGVPWMRPRRRPVSAARCRAGGGPPRRPVSDHRHRHSKSTLQVPGSSAAGGTSPPEN